MASNQLAASRGFQAPLDVADPKDCLFYHSMELPDLGLQVGAWDLREHVERYLGDVSYTGKRVVDVGTASGYLAFEMERRGASVVAFDRGFSEQPADDMGLVPFARYAPGALDGLIKMQVANQRRVRNSFWLAHRLLQSRAQLFYGSVYECPDEIGAVDYAFFGAILLHLRDPLQAIASFARHAREKVIITEPFANIGPYETAPVMLFRPSVADPANVATWWYITPALLQQYLGILGFSEFTLLHHEAVHVLDDNRRVPFFTLVAGREQSTG